MRALVWCLVFTLTFLAYPVRAAKPLTFCTQDFASLARSPEEIETLTTTTYEKLLDLVQDPDVKRRVLENIVSGKDPFALPKDERDLAILKKPLAQLHDMLKELKWETPKLTRTLVAVAKAKLKGNDDAQVQVAKTLNENLLIKFPMPDAIGLQQSPDGRYFYTLPEVDEGIEIAVHDRVTGKTERIPISSPGGGAGVSIALNADGTKLIVTARRTRLELANHVIQIHDLVNGKPSAEGTRIGIPPAPYAGRKKRKEDYVRKVVQLANPAWMLGEISQRHQTEHGAGQASRLHLIDFAKKKTVLLDPQPEKGHWVPIAGTNSAVVITTPSEPRKRRTMRVLEVGAGGQTTITKVQMPTGLKELEQSYSAINAQGDRIALPNRKSGEVVVMDWRTGNTLRFPAPSVEHMPSPHLHPNGKELAVVGFDEEKNTSLVYWYDIASQKKLGEFTLPPGWVSFSPDGQSLVLRTLDQVQIFPLTRLLPDATRP